MRGLSEDEMKEQAARCPCGGADDMCVCQNVPDAITRKVWGLHDNRKHTPGRWQSQGWVPTWTYIPVHDERHNVICSVYPHPQRGVSYDEAALRARLIAAAPSLLEALQVLLEVHDALGAGKSTAAIKAREAISLATAHIGD